MTLRDSIRRRGALAPLFLIFFACSTPPSWHSDLIGDTPNQAERYLFHPEEPGSQAELEILKASYGTRATIRLLGRPLPSNLKQVNVLIQRPSAERTVTGEKLEGSEVILLPEDESEAILDDLLKGECITLKVAGVELLLPAIDKRLSEESSLLSSPLSWFRDSPDSEAL